MSPPPGLPPNRGEEKPQHGRSPHSTESGVPLPPIRGEAGWGASLRGVTPFICALTFALSASAQPTWRRSPPQFRPIGVIPPPAPPAPTLSDDPRDLRGRFGVERASSLLHSIDPDDHLRGIERAAALGTPEALTLLLQQTETAALSRLDARAKIALARGLATHTDKAPAREALLVLAQMPTPRASPQRTDSEDPSHAARLEMARRIAALALAESGDLRSVEALVALAANETNGASSRNTPGAGAALAALAAYPPRGSATWARPMTAGMAKLVARTGDLRARGEVLEAAKKGDASARAAAIEALGELGDARVLEIASSMLADGESARSAGRSAPGDDARVRVAAASALVALGDPAAPRAVEGLLADDTTAAQGIALAMNAHGGGIVKALAARAAAAPDLAVRAAAVAALGRDPTSDGVEALGALMADPLLRADALDAIARSPSATAMGAIERLAASPATRRLASRAYVVRALVRGESSGALEKALAELVASSDGRDRAAGVFAQVALSEASVTRGLEDGDARVRRAAAMGTLGKLNGATRAALLSRRAREEDPPTRTALAAGLVEGDEAALVTTGDLRTCAHAGGADAPLCTLAIAHRASEATGAEVHALLASRDPIVRAHAARGLAGSTDPSRGGRLVAAYAYEPDPLVRRALLDALATVPRDASGIADPLALAARLDPDPEIRAVAARLATPHPAAATADDGDVAWIHLVDASGGPPPEGATGALLRADGLAIPIVFDADGDAVVPGLPPGTARLLLAPRLDAAYAPSSQ